MRQAIRLATAAGQGREVALLHNNLGVNLWSFEGPRAALAELRTGMAYGAARGLAEIADIATASTLSLLFDTGQHDEALILAGTLTDRVNDDQITLSEVRAIEARIYALRGEAPHAAAYLDWLEITSRDARIGQILALGLGAAAITHIALGDAIHAATLLRELAATQDTRENSYYAPLLPELVRAAISIGQPSIAESLTSDYRPRMPYAHHAQVAAAAILAEARGDHQTAADTYADAAKRWEEFGVTPEQAHALQGHGRCLIPLGRPNDAAPVLHHAHELFTQLRATPALTETDTLLQHATALSS